MVAGRLKDLEIHEGQRGKGELTLAVGALLRALASSRRALSYSLFSDSSLTAASQISSLLGLACGRVCIGVTGGKVNFLHKLVPTSVHRS